jgi:hypothetical protein
MDGINVAQCTDKLRALVKAVINFWFHKIRENAWLPVELLDSQDESCSMELLIMKINFVIREG